MKRMTLASLLLTFILVAGHAEALPLPTGNWNINGNGSTGVLTITSINAQGQLTGTVYGQPLIGFWDSASNKILFMRLINTSQPATFQIYTGYLFRNPITPQGGQNVTYTLTGYFVAFSGSGGTAQMNHFGWFAQVTVVG